MWPNGGGAELRPGDYYCVRFLASHGDVPAGAVGIVVDHVGSPADAGCVVEVTPFGHDGEPACVVIVDAGKLALEEESTR